MKKDTHKPNVNHAHDRVLVMLESIHVTESVVLDLIVASEKKNMQDQCHAELKTANVEYISNGIVLKTYLRESISLR